MRCHSRDTNETFCSEKPSVAIILRLSEKCPQSDWTNMRSNKVRYGVIKVFLAILACLRKINITQLYSFFGNLRMSLEVILGFRNEIYGLDSVIYGYVRSYEIGVGYARSYTITEGACPRFVTHLAKNGPHNNTGGCIRSDLERYVRKMRDTVYG